MFVFSTIISAGFFGQIQAEILFGRKFSKIWVFMYPLFIGIACAFSNVTTMYMITDGFMAIIVILNMIGLLLIVSGLLLLVTALGIIGLQSVLDVERVAIGGGISAADALLPAIQTELDDLFARCPVFPMLEPELVRCRYGNDANMIGALKLFFERNPA